MAMGSDQSFTNLSCNSVERHPKKSNLSPCKIDTANRPKERTGGEQGMWETGWEKRNFR